MSPVTNTMPESTVKLEIRSYDSESKKHCHRYHQLVLPLAGELRLAVDHQEGAVVRHKAAVIPSGRDHGFAAPADNRFLVADIPEQVAPDLERVPRFVELDPALLHYVRFLEAQVSLRTTSGGSERQMVLLLVQLLQERYGEKPDLDRRIAAARHFLDSHFQRRITLQDVATAAHLSVRQLNELFKRQVGITPHQYLTELRMQQALQLLEQSRLSIQQIAERVGYSTLASFSARFAQHFGKPPSHFRNIAQ